ncbi:hypothetical protein GQ457_08G026040 [Hibiscus cannabinus]
MKLFPYSLSDKAKAWLDNLTPGSLQNWIDLCRSFLACFRHNNMTDKLRNEITSFRQEDDEQCTRHENVIETYLDVAQCMDSRSGIKYPSSIILQYSEKVDA